MTETTAAEAQRPGLQAGEPHHPSSEQFERFLRGVSSREEARAIVRHLLAQCPRCAAMAHKISLPGDPLLRVETAVREMVTSGEPLYDKPIHDPRRDAKVSEGEEAAREQLRGIVEELDGIRARLVDLHARLPVPAEETAMLVGEVEMDFPTEVRSVIECVLNDSLRPMMRDLAVAASCQPKKQASP